MLRHKKEMKQHHLAEFHKKLEELMQRYHAMYKANPALNDDKSFFRQREQEIDALAKEYGVNWSKCPETDRHKYMSKASMFVQEMCLEGRISS